MYNRNGNPLLNPWSLLLVGVSLSIGWGIRGNFGHESGAMIPGALAAIAIALLSRREDWRRNVAFFALFGGLGWGFGGSISYAYGMSYTNSGQLATTAFGFFTMFLIGGLWAGLGGAGTALPAVASRERLTQLVTPLCFVLGAMFIGHWIDGPIARALASAASDGIDGTWNRHKSPLYWFDADWFPALMALAGVCAYDLWSRRFQKGVALVLMALAGAVTAALGQFILGKIGLLDPLVNFLVVPLGDATAINPETGQAFDPDNFLTNWPQFFGDFPQHVGWGLGLLAGAGLYFTRHGQWRSGSSLFLYMALGWFVAFLAMPVLGTIFLQPVGGFRLTPPRSDDWAGVLGVFIAVVVWTRRNGLSPVAHTASLTFILGGIAFASVQFIRMLLTIPGHPYRTEGGTPPFWQHYQGANWHSIMEQSHGFGHGLAICIAMALLWRRVPPRTSEPQTRMWTEVFAVVFVFFGMVHMNLFKSVGTWTGGSRPVMPESMKAPLLGFIELNALTWYNLVWFAAAIAGTVLLAQHLRRRFDVVPRTWVGKGQLLYLAILWVMIVGNFGRALPSFSEGRLITEWVIAMNGVLATFLLVTLPRPDFHESSVVPDDIAPKLRPLWLKGLAALAVMVLVYTAGVRLFYGDATGSAQQYAHKRFGDEAVWRIAPILKNRDHR